MELFDEAVTQKDRISAVMVNCVGATRLGGSEVRLPKGWVVSGVKISNEESDFTLARKAAKKKPCARTANRRRWARREF